MTSGYHIGIAFPSSRPFWGQRSVGTWAVQGEIVDSRPLQLVPNSPNAERPDNFYSKEYKTIVALIV